MRAWCNGSTPVSEAGLRTSNSQKGFDSPCPRQKTRVKIMNFNKCIIGISKQSNIDELLKLGFRQFYFGYIDEDYIKKYSTQISPNRRYRLKEQYTSYEHILKDIEKIKQSKGIVYLAINSFFTNKILLDEIKKYVKLFENYVDGMIVANMPTLLYLQSLGYENIVLSNLFGFYSKKTVEFFLQFSPIKIILPRDIMLEELQEIVSCYKDVNFEAFLFGDNCRFSEAFCFSEHGYDSLEFGSLCSYALNSKQVINKADIHFKHTIKNPKISNEDKKAFLVTDYIYSDYKTLNKDDDFYKIFHKTNKTAIIKTIKFFEKFPNITSYKIPSRGREFVRFLLEESSEEYNYKESQYDL